MTGQGPRPMPPPAAEVEFGNLEANRRFLDDSDLLRPGVRVLEIGSGRGTLLAELRSRELEVIGLETSEERINEAHVRYPGLPIWQTTGTTLPFPDESFDLVVSFDVFEHIPDSDAHLSEVRRVLTRSGWYLLQTPNKWTNTVFETIRWRSFTRWRADHCSLHTYGQLARRLKKHGFEPHFDDVKVVTPFFRKKVWRYLGIGGAVLLTLLNPDRLPLRLRTNFYVRAQKQPRH